jgi:propionyl-CoA carboxylase beta chain
VTIVNRRDIAGADDPGATRDALASEYADEHLSAGVAAAEGFVDEVILPDDTRRRLCEALTTLDAIAHPAHGVRNIPL